MNRAQRFQFKMSLMTGMASGMVTGFLFSSLTKWGDNIIMVFIILIFSMIIFIILLWSLDKVLSKDKDGWS